MSSYRSNYIPWQKNPTSPATNNNKQTIKERTSPATNNLYGVRTPAYNTSSITSASTNSQSTTSAPTATGYQYRKTPSILKKYANFTQPSSNKYPDVPRPNKTSTPDTKDATKTIGIPRIRPVNSAESSNGSMFNGSSSNRFKGFVPKVKEPPSELITQVTRSTSPTPYRNSSHVKKRNDDDVIISEILKRGNILTTNNSTQTEPHDPSASRVAVLTNKFSTGNGSTNKFSPRNGGYNYTRPTDLPICSPSLTRSFPSPESELNLSPGYCIPPPEIFRTPSPLTNLNKALSELKIQQQDAESDTESESSYDENYPGKLENEPYALIFNSQEVTVVSEFLDKPPPYPLSPNGRAKNVINVGINDSKLSNGCSSSSNDLSDKNIPIMCQDSVCNFHYKSSDESDSPTKKFFPIREMDSGELPWWQNSNSDKSDHHSNEVWWNKDPSRIECEDGKTDSGTNLRNCDDSNRVEEHSTYVIRKRNSFDIPRWSKSSNIEENIEPVNEKMIPQIRKMDSNEILWACNSEGSNCLNDKTENLPLNVFKIQKFDSEEGDWWAEDEQSKTDTPDCCNLKVEDSNEYIENYTSRKGFRITKIEPVEYESKLEDCMLNDYQMQKIDCVEEAWWMQNDSDKGKIRSELKSEESCLSNGMEQSLETGGTYKLNYIDELENLLLYIGKYTNIDDLLGTEVPISAASTSLAISSDDEIASNCQKITASQVKIHDGSAYTSTIKRRLPVSQLDDAALQLYKDGDYGSYLDLDCSISEQQEEFEGFQPNRKDSIVVRTQLSVRVHLIIEKLMKSEGRDLRRALFSLKQIFQEDKDLVHEFVQNYGLDCLIKVGSDVDQNYQNYILRALGQVMLYVDGMNGVMEHNPTIQWLYSLVSSKFRLVVKTALKLLLVFVEYVESNCLLLIKAIHTLNTSQGVLPWSNLMKLLHEYNATDTELLIYATTLINKTLNGIPDQDTYYDQVDLLEEQDMESVIRKYMSKPGTDLDLLRQFQIYEAVLQHEDGEEKGAPLKQLDETIRKNLRNRKSLTGGTVNKEERRKSRRHSTGTTALSHAVSLTLAKHLSETSSVEEYRIKQNDAAVTPDLRTHRQRTERRQSLMREQYEYDRLLMDTSSTEDGSKSDILNGVPAVYANNSVCKLEPVEDLSARVYCNGEVSPTLKREATVKGITQKLASLQTPDETTTSKSQNMGRVEEMKGIISKAMEGLAKSQSRCEILRSPTSETVPSQTANRVAEVKKSETDLHWEELVATSKRALQLCDLDFSDLCSDEEQDILAPANSINGVPPPPPPCGLPPPVPSVPKTILNKEKKTVKLFWKEVREDPIVITKLNSKQLIWDEIFPVIVDTQRLEHLFESRAKDLISKKQHELNKNKEIIVLDPKRSNAINIGMTKLPPPRSIKTAILKMDSTVMNREGIEKLLTMLPTEEERSKIQEAQVANPDLPLGSAEHFLLTLASISELTARLKLWSFKLNYENIEKEIADPLMDLKQGMEVLRANRTFRAILSTLLSIGIFLNGTEVKGFQIEYLAKVPEVKDTVHKHSLLHHLCYMVMEKFPDSTDLYSEIGAVTRASRVDFVDLNNSIIRIEEECKASFDYLKAIAKHDTGNNNATVKVKISEFLADCAERIIALEKIHKRVMNRFYKFCLWLGIPLHRIQGTKPNEVYRIISEFALEYRTTRERVIQQLEKKASHRERNKTRGKMITDVGKFRSKEDRQDAELRQLLGKEHNVGNEHKNNNNIQGGLTWRRQKREAISKDLMGQNINGYIVDADDELLETLVKTATKTPAARNSNRERKRTRHNDRKSLIPKRSRTRDNIAERRGLSESP